MAEHDKTTVDELYKIATWLRIDSIESTNAAKSGHPTSCASAAEIMACLFFKVMHYEVANPRNPNSDRFILSKGHAAPILYSAWAEAGLFPREDLLNLRKIDCDLEGHPTPRLSFVDVASGSLGQGLSAASGMAYVGKYIDCGENHGQSPFRVFCLIGDGESAEGSNWEAMAFASYYKLDNLYAIFDVNRLGQSQPTMLQHDVDVYRARAEAFGFAAYVVNGHSVEELLTVFENAAARNDGRPTAIIAQTFKGFDFPGISNLEDWHGKPISSGGNELTANVLQHLREKVEALTSSGDSSAHSLKPPAPVSQSLHDLSHFVGGSEKVLLSSPPNYHKGQLVATRQAYGTALVKLGENNKQVIGLDGDTKNSTFSIKLRDKRPGQFIECFIAEQNLAGVAIGAACRGRTIPFASTFACFFTRAFDQIRMAAISQSHCNFVGSHAGVSIGEDGPSQMALEDLAMFRSIPNAVVFYPTDAVATERAVELAANQPSICFIRTGRPNAPVIYANDEVFEIGKAKVVRSSDHDVVTVIGAGVTLTETLAAADQLAAENIHIRVIDPFTIKPIDSKAIIEAAKATGGRIITVEDHYPEGGLGEAVLTAVSEETGIIVRKIAITHLPRSGKPEELLALFGIDAAGIAKAVKAFL